MAGLEGGAATPYELAQHLWGSRLDYHQRRFAMVEGAAHLVRLVALGRAREVAPFRFAVRVSDTTRMLDISGLGCAGREGA